MRPVNRFFTFQRLLMLGLLMSACCVFLGTQEVQAAVAPPSAGGSPPSPITTAYHNQKVAQGEALSCSDNPSTPQDESQTWTRYMKHFSSPDLTTINAGIPYDITTNSSITVTPWTGYYVCNNPTSACCGPRYDSQHYVQLGIKKGAQYTNSDMENTADASIQRINLTSPQVLPNNVNPGSGSTWLNWGTQTISSLSPGWNTISVNFLPATCTRVTSGANAGQCSSIQNISADIRLIYYDPPVDYASCNSLSYPSSVGAGQAFTGTVSFFNAGTTTWIHNSTDGWKAGGNYVDTTHKDENTWGVRRVSTAGSTAPGTLSPIFTINATAPSTPGTYSFNWAMINEFDYWLDPPNGTMSTYGSLFPVCHGTITVNASSAIACSLSASPASIATGGSSTLTWSSSGAPTSASLSPGIGAVATAGSISVSPGSTTAYTLTVSKPATPDATCNQTISVAASPPVPGGRRRLGPWDSITNLPPVL